MQRSRLLSWARWSSNVLRACEGLDDEHRGTAVPADERGPEGGVAGGILRSATVSSGDIRMATLAYI